MHSIKQARDRGGDLRFFGRGTEADGSFRRLLVLCGVQAMFLTYPSRDAAVASFVDGSGPGAEG